MEDKKNKKALRLGVLQGMLVEIYARYKIQGEGSLVSKLVGQGDKFIFLKNNNVSRLIQDCEENTEDFIQFLKDNINGLPDFICVKDNKISFVEVKSNNSGLSDKQKEVFEILRKKGYEVILRNFKIKLDIKEEPYIEYDKEDK
jgi:hypothetical protein|tara:strand:- start:154 stop:585 length:432 start_codon:yes stop_codon:yes gene_type:complete